jgi:hypothetical protein
MYVFLSHIFFFLSIPLIPFFSHNTFNPFMFLFNLIEIEDFNNFLKIKERVEHKTYLDYICLMVIRAKNSVYFISNNLSF